MIEQLQATANEEKPEGLELELGTTAAMQQQLASIQTQASAFDMLQVSPYLSRQIDPK